MTWGHPCQTAYIHLDGIQYADKQTLTYASLMNIRQDIGLNLASQEYAWCG